MFTIDALVSIIIIVIGLILISSSYYYTPDNGNMDALTADMINLLSRINVGDVCDLTTCTCSYDSLTSICSDYLSSEDMTMLELFGVLYNKNKRDEIENIVNETIIEPRILPSNYEMAIMLQDPNSPGNIEQLFPNKIIP